MRFENAVHSTPLAFPRAEENNFHRLSKDDETLLTGSICGSTSS